MTMSGRTPLLLCLCLLAAGGATAMVMTDTATACGKMGANWMPAESIPKEVSWAVYKAAYDRYMGSGLPIDWAPWYCPEPEYTYEGCYANSTANDRSNYMFYQNATCTGDAGKSYTLGMTADASWYNATAYAYDADLAYVWGGDEEYSMEELRGVWWEKNDDYYYEEEPVVPEKPVEPEKPEEPEMPAANPYRRML